MENVIGFFEKMKPLYVAMMLEMMSGDDSLLTNSDPFLDQHFEEMYRADN